MTYEQYVKGNGKDRSSEEIQSDLGEIRDEITHTLDSLSQRLRPGKMLQEALRSFQEGGGGRFTHNLSRAVQENPVPLAMIAAGFGYLIYSDAQQRKTGRSEGEGEYESGGTSTGAQAKDTARRLGNAAKGGVRAAGERMNEAKERLGEASAKAGARVRSARDYGQTLLHDQPLVLAGLGLAIGAAVAGLAPLSRREDETLGKAGRKGRKGAHRLAGQALDKGKEAGGKAVGGAQALLSGSSEEDPSSPASDGRQNEAAGESRRQTTSSVDAAASTLPPPAGNAPGAPSLRPTFGAPPNPRQR